MATGRCQSCNADLPRGARFCARCGVGVAEIPVLDLTGAGASEAEISGEDVPASRTRIARTLVVLVLVGVIVMLVLSALADGDDGEETEDESSGAQTTTSTAARTGSSTTALPESLTFPDEAVLADSFGLVVLLAEEGQLTVFDPETGARHVEPSPFGSTPELTATDSRVFALEPGAETISILLEDSLWAQIGIDDWRPVYVGPSGVVELASRTPGSGGDGAGALAVVSDDGQTSVFDRRALLRGGWGWGPIGEIDGDLVVGTMDGIFRVGVDGSARRLASGQPLAMSESTMVVQSCDDTMRCGPSLIDLRSEETRPLPEFPGSIVLASVSTDGAHVLVGSVDDSFGSDLFAHVLIGDQWVPAEAEAGWQLSTAVWGEGGAMWWDPDGRRLVAVSVEGSGDISEDLRLDVDVHSAVVVPRSTLPEAWQTALDEP